MASIEASFTYNLLSLDADDLQVLDSALCEFIDKRKNSTHAYVAGKLLNEVLKAKSGYLAKGN